MRQLLFNAAEFMRVFNQAHAEGRDQVWVASQLGIRLPQVRTRKQALRKRGFYLPKLLRKDFQKPRKAAKAMLRLMAPVACAVEPVALHFTLTVGADHA